MASHDYYGTGPNPNQSYNQPPPGQQPPGYDAYGVPPPQGHSGGGYGQEQQYPPQTHSPYPQHDQVRKRFLSPLPSSNVRLLNDLLAC